MDYLLQYVVLLPYLELLGIEVIMHAGLHAPLLSEVIVEGGFTGGELALVCGLIECCHFLHKTDETGGCLRNT